MISPVDCGTWTNKCISPNSTKALGMSENELDQKDKAGRKKRKKSIFSPCGYYDSITRKGL